MVLNAFKEGNNLFSMILLDRTQRNGLKAQGGWLTSDIRETHNG